MLVLKKLFILLIVLIFVMIFFSIFWNIVFMNTVVNHNMFSFDQIIVGTIESLRAPFFDIKFNLEHIWNIGYLIVLLICLGLLLTGVMVSVRGYFVNVFLLNWYLFGFAVSMFIWIFWGRISLMTNF